MFLLETFRYFFFICVKILEQVRYRVEWLKFQERERKKEEDALEKERGN